jgi:hypothetical protein
MSTPTRNDENVDDASNGVRRSEKSSVAVDDFLGVDVRRDAVAWENSASLPRDPEVNGPGSEGMKTENRVTRRLEKNCQIFQK